MCDVSQLSGTAPNSCGGKCQMADPCHYMKQDFALGLELCGLLEDIADSLPHELSAHQADVANHTLTVYLPDHVGVVEDVIFPRIEERLAPQHPLIGIVKQLRDEHAHSSGAALELGELLDAAASNKKPTNSEAFAYTLRSFFEGHRRHIAWEREMFLPTLPHYLLPADQQEFMSWLQHADRRGCASQHIRMLKTARTPRLTKSQKTVPASLALN